MSGFITGGSSTLWGADERLLEMALLCWNASTRITSDEIVHREHPRFSQQVHREYYNLVQPGAGGMASFGRRQYGFLSTSALPTLPFRRMCDVPNSSPRCTSVRIHKPQIMIRSIKSSALPSRLADGPLFPSGSPTPERLDGRENRGGPH